MKILVAQLRVAALQSEEKLVPDRVKNLQISTRKISRKAGDNCIRLDIGQPSFDTPQHVKDAVKSGLEEKQCYTSTGGIDELKKLISKEESMKSGVSVEPENVMVASGGMDALSTVSSALTRSDDKIVVNDPCWAPYKALSQVNENKVVQVKFWSDNGGLREEARKEIKDSKMVILNNPQNPTGRVLKKEQVKEISGVAEKHDTVLVSDEVYHRILFEGEHVSPWHYCSNTVIIGSMSKNHGMTGWRIGWIVAPKKLIETFEKASWASSIAPSKIGQIAAIQALKKDPHVEKMRKTYRKRRDIALEHMKDLKWSFQKPRGSIYAFPDIGMDSEEFCLEMLEKGVAIVPGTSFGTDSSTNIRVCFGSADKQEIVEAFNRVKERVNF